MQKNIIIVILIVVLVASVVGLCAIGYQLYTTQAAVAKLAESVRARDELIDSLLGNATSLRSDATKLREQLSEFKRIVAARQANDREALRILAEATHR